MEEWRNVPGFEGRYQIDISTKEGRCRSLNYLGHKGKIKELSNKPNKYGRIIWCLAKDDKKVVKQAAAWIALTYPEPIQNEYFEGAEIDHIDTDRLNNHPSNLRWVTSKENHNNPLTRKHMSENRKGDKCYWIKKGEENHMWGKKLSEEHKKNISNSLKRFYKEKREP